VSASTRVDFYILEATEPNARMQFACRLTEKAYGLGNAVYAHAASDKDADSLDDLLWTFRQGSFIPHEPLHKRSPAEEISAPVCIGTPTACLQEGQLLINLTDNTPEFAANFSRIAEIVDGSEASRKAGRQRFKDYKKLGLEPETHTIK
jgi:DNA polymerase-3 subunit chi